MSGWRKKFLVSLMIAALSTTWVASSALAQEGSMLLTEEASSTAMLADLVFLRPVGLAAIAVGTGAFIISLPFSILGGNTGQAGQKLVVNPAKYTFSRPLGVSEY
ncbi:MAG: multidrug transporter [Deltaproteobacteria bacterium]|nr:MAG: multidrug transporter [Deltaproteobacteria bacterium]